MPRLSPAVLNGRPTNGSQQMMSLGSTPIPPLQPRGHIQQSLPPVKSPVPAAVPKPTTTAVEHEPAVQLWCQLASETTRAQQSDTVRAAPGAVPATRSRLGLWIAIGAGVALAGAGGVATAFLSKPKPGDAPATAAGR
jgi:hypothetical protein